MQILTGSKIQPKSVTSPSTSCSPSIRQQESDVESDDTLSAKQRIITNRNASTSMTFNVSQQQIRRKEVENDDSNKDLLQHIKSN